MKLTDRQGRLTAYAFACGYVERDGGFRLSHRHGVYHIEGFGSTGAHFHWAVRTLTAACTILRQAGHAYGTLPIDRAVIAPTHREA